MAEKIESSLRVFVYLKPIPSQWQIPVKMSINLHGKWERVAPFFLLQLQIARSGYWKMLINTLENSLNCRLVSVPPDWSRGCACAWMPICRMLPFITMIADYAVFLPENGWHDRWTQACALSSRRASSIQHRASNAQGFQGSRRSHEAADHCSVTVRLQWGSNERLLFK